MRLSWLWVAVAVTAALAQQGGQEKGQEKKAPPPEKKEPAPLFEGKLGTKSSQKTKESATLGFNGIDPSGKVDSKLLAATPSATDQAKAQALTAVRPTQTELEAFLKEGELNKK